MPANTSYTWEKYDWLNPFTNKPVAAYPAAGSQLLPVSSPARTINVSGNLTVSGTTTFRT